MVRLLALLIAPFLLLSGAAARAQGNELVGTYRVDLGATASMSDSYSRVDNTTVLRTATTTVGPGARDMGSLEIRADGTYRLRYWEYDLIYKAPLVSGRWQPVAADDPFAYLGAIELLGAKPDPKYEDKDRKWYVFRTENGDVEARYPPYDGYAKIRLSGGSKGGGAAVVREREGRADAPAAGPAPAGPVPAAAAAANRTFTPDQVRQALTGRSVAEVHALLGPPIKVAYGTHYFNGVENVFPHCANGCNWKSFAIQFGGPGETASSIELQYWLAE